MTPSTVKERPILFSGEMVRAILEGRKTQTRRVFKITGPMGDKVAITSPHEEITRFDDGTFHYLSTSAMSGPYDCPYGVPGDRLWVRETWRPTGDWSDLSIREITERAEIHSQVGQKLAYKADADDGVAPWIVSIHMPRWASRLTLEVTGVRAERLQDISDGDAKAEGVEPFGDGFKHYFFPNEPHAAWEFATNSYASLWDKINGAGAWDKNPWVWVVKFKQAKP